MSGGEDGSETPSASETPPAPESPEAETPAAPQEPVEQADEGRVESRRPRLLPVWILLGTAVLAGGAWAVTERVGGEGGPPPDEASVPLITASAEPWKVRPDDPGGLKIPNQGTLIYETLSTAEPEEAPERVLPPPEAPLAPPKPEPDSAEALAVAGSGADTAVAALEPDAGGVEEPALSPTTGEAPPPEPEAPTEPDSLEEAPPPEPDEPPEFAAVEEAPPLDLEVSESTGFCCRRRPSRERLRPYWPRRRDGRSSMSRRRSKSPRGKPSHRQQSSHRRNWRLTRWLWSKRCCSETLGRLPRPPKLTRRTLCRCPRTSRAPWHGPSRLEKRSLHRQRINPAPGVTFNSAPRTPEAHWRRSGRCSAAATTMRSSALAR